MLNKKDKLEKFTDLCLGAFLISMLITFDGKSSPFYIAMVFLFGVVFLLNVIKQKKILVNGYLKWIGLFTGLNLLSVLWAVNKGNALALIPILAVNEAIAYMVACLISYKPERKWLVMKSIIAGAILLGVRVFLTHGLFVFNDARGVGGLNANYMGMYAGIAASLCLLLWRESKRSDARKDRYPGLFIACIIVALLSFSRKALAFIALPILLYFILSGKKTSVLIRRALLILGMAGLGLLAIFNVDFLYNSVGSRIEPIFRALTTTSRIGDASVQARVSFIKYGEKFFTERPMIGAGANNFKNLIAAAKPYGMTNVYAHNNYVEIAVDFGVVGLVIYYGFYLIMVFYGLKNRKNLSPIQLMFLCILITLMVCEVGIVSYYGNFYQLLLALTWYVLFNTDAKKKAKNGKKR